MRYQLRPITQENWRTAASLEVAPNQKGFIEENTVSLLEAVYDTTFNWTPVGLYVDHKMVGFAMIGAENLSERSLWFDRFMIDHHHQHQGYGHALFRSVLTYLKEHYKQVDTIYLSVKDKNKKAFPFYESFGFDYSTEKKGKKNETILYLKIDRT